MKPIALIGVVTAGLVMFTGCFHKKVTPPLTDLLMGVDFQLLGYHEYYAKDSTGFFQITSTGSTVALGFTGNFLEEQIMTSQDSILPDVTKGHYNRIRFVAPDTLEQQYNSLVAEKPMTSHLKCPVTFTEGTLADLSAGSDVKLKHTPTAVEELKAMYVTQLEREYTPMVTEMMWKEIERRSSKDFKAEEARQRYRLTVSNRVETIEVPQALISMKGDTAVMWYPNRLYFSLKFTGRIDIVK